MKKKIKQQQEPEKTENNIRREKTGISAYNRTGYKTMIKKNGTWKNRKRITKGKKRYLGKNRKEYQKEEQVPGKIEKNNKRKKTVTWKNRKELKKEKTGAWNK